jgi:hypothetical protein
MRPTGSLATMDLQECFHHLRLASPASRRLAPFAVRCPRTRSVEMMELEGAVMGARYSPYLCMTVVAGKRAGNDSARAHDPDVRVPARHHVSLAG